MATGWKNLSIWILVLAILLRAFLSISSTISGDACWHFSASKFIAENWKIPFDENLGRSKFESFWPSPLFHIVAAFFYSFLGEPGLKIAPLLFGSLSLIVSYFIFRKLLDEKACFYATLFLSFIPIAIDYSILGYPESAVSFFVVLSLYFAICGKFLYSGIATGLAILSKFTGIFIVPALIYIVWKSSQKKDLAKNLFFVILVPGLVSLPWFIRNWILLGNPVWPFMNFIFHGFQAESYSNFSLTNLIQPSTYAITYLGFFGVPDGHYRAFFFFDVPFIGALITIFIIGTLIYILPVFFGFERKKEYSPIYALLAAFALVLLLFELNVRPAVSRIVLPAMVGVAFVYGIGMKTLMDKYKKAHRIILILTILVILGFVLSEAIKFRIASDAWKAYDGDFKWIKENTPENAVFLNGGQCIRFKSGRSVLYPEEEGLSSVNFDYVWVNQDFKLEPQSVMEEDDLSVIKSRGPVLVYSNAKTGTSIYKMP